MFCLRYNMKLNTNYSALSDTFLQLKPLLRFQKQMWNSNRELPGKKNKKYTTLVCYFDKDMGWGRGGSIEETRKYI